MTRSRSRSPRRERRRSTSRERERRRRERPRSRSRSPKRRHRSRSKSPRRRRSISPRRRTISSSPEPSGSDKTTDAPAPVKDDRKKIDEETLETMSEEDKEMYKIMGFVNFDTTKGKKTAESTNADAAQILEKRKYRQYMNRRGGFNRPLDFIA
ncbi:uncharacterized protein [Apostichopus japonicus]|uniref:uncharacterized protein n=1 Tax=Stichopus japonicus TaxID=307972 RepID=UPI003AB52FE2